MAEGEAEKRKIARLNFDVEDAKNSLTSVAKALEQLSTNSEKSFKNIEANFSKALSGGDYSKQIQELQKKMKKYEELTESQQKSVSTSLHKEMNKRFTKQQEITEKTNYENVKAANKEVLINTEKNARIEIDNNKHANKMEEINTRQAKSVKTMYDKIAEYAKTYVIYQGFNALKKAASETVQEMIDVQYQMIAIDRVLNESSLDIDHYRDKLMQLAYDYGNSFNNVADITLRLAQAGFDSQEAIALTEKTLLALNTAELDATQATDDMVAVMAQWGLMTGTAAEQAQSYGDIIDKINKVADNFPTTSADIMDALKKVSSAFNLAGADIDETIATIVAAEKASQRGGKVIGTALSNITQQLKAEGKLNLAEQLGLDFFEDDAKTKFKPIMKIFQEIADRMEQLKKEGKESSTEMQSLLELFTVFRRNVGASLLGEMAGGEESTYMQVYTTSIESVGYSLQENEKYMKSAKAAQEQFNTTLLQLKTAVWDNGLEDVFRTMLMLGNDISKSIKFLIDTFGSIPSAIGLATMAMTAFNKQLKVQVSYKPGEGFGINGELLNKIKQADKDVKALTSNVLQLGNANVKANASLTQYVEEVGLANVSTKGYVSYLVKQKAATIAAEAATLALNTALSLGLSAGITLIISGLDKLIHAEENAAKAAQERTNEIKDRISETNQEIETIDNAIKAYEDLEKAYSSGEEVEDKLKIKEVQAQITAQLKEQRQYTSDLKDDYDAQLKKLKEISQEKREQLITEQKELLANAEIAKKTTKLGDDFWGTKRKDLVDLGFNSDYFSQYEGLTARYDKAKEDSRFNKNLIFDVFEAVNYGDFEEQLKILTEMRDKLEEAYYSGQDVGDTYTYIAEKLSELEERQNAVAEAQDKLNELLEENMSLSEFDIQNYEDYLEVLDLIAQSGEEILPEGYSESLEKFKEQLLDLINNAYPEFAKKVEETNSGIEVSQQTISNLSKAIQDSIQSLADLDTGFSSVYSAMEEFNNQGYMSASTLQNLINNDLLQYFDVVNGKLSVNEVAMANAATAAKAKAIEDLQAEAAAKIAALAFNEAATGAKTEGGAADIASEKTNRVKNALMQMTPEALKAADAWHKLNYELSGAMDGLADDTKNEIQSIMTNLSRSITAINAVKIEAVSYRRASASSARSASSSAETASKKAAQEAEKAAQEAEKKAEEIYKNSLSQFKDYMTEFERLEKRWVTKQKDLGLLSTDDYLYITQQRIKRYQEYLDEIRKATWLNNEDRLELEKKYTEGLEDLQVDYLEYVKDKLDEEVEALEDANEKKIDTIEEEAQARIDALKKVENETDRIREKEEYERKRQEHLDDISYWEQRTGREAQEALLEARKKLEELDREWEQKQEDWDISDQIKAIEDERDAQVKAIEDAQQAEIDAMTAVYDAKVKMFTDTGEIIYENSVIQSQNLYKAYKNNFIDPVASELTKLNQSLASNVSQSTAKANTGSTSTTPTSTQQQYTTYTIKSGDTLTKIAREYGTTIEKILQANPYVTNRNLIYTGKTLQIPKFHEGGIFGTSGEGLALLKNGEMVLKPEWSEQMNRFVKYVSNITNTQGKPVATGPNITVSGDLVRIEASVRNQNDIDALGRKVEKILNDKFNIKK